MMFDIRRPQSACAADQRVVFTVVQSANPIAVEYLLVDFQARDRKKVGREFFDCETDRIRRAREPPYPMGGRLTLRLSTGNNATSFLVGNNSATMS